MSRDDETTRGSAERRAPLARVLDRMDATMVVFGVIVGAGIFYTPAAVAGKLPDARWILAAWFLGGISAAAGSLTFAELGALLPRSGGIYVYLREAYGDGTAFVYGWLLLLASNSGSIAVVAGIFAEYVGYFARLSPAGTKLAACAAILLLAAANCLGVRIGSGVQNIFTLLKMGVLGGIVTLGLLLGSSGETVSTAAAPGPMAFGAGTLLFLGAAMVPVFFTYGGWHHVNTIAGELKRPERDLPFALLTGIAGVTVVYLLANLAYLRHLPVDAMASAKLVAAEAAEDFLGPAGAKVVAGAILISCFGIVNALILTSPRIYHAMAADGLFFSWAAWTHPVFKTPVAAIGVQALWASVLVIVGGPARLMNYLVFVDCLFFAAVGVALFILRARWKNVERPFRTWLYPVTPALFAAIQVGVAAAVFYSATPESLAGVIIAGCGTGAYVIRRYFRRSRGN